MTSLVADFGMNIREAWNPTTDKWHRSRLLRRFLLVNSAFSGASGLVFAAAGPHLDELFGLPALVPAREVGLALLPFALAVAWIATRPGVRGPALAIIALDLLWVAGSVLLALAASTLTALGTLAVLSTSAAVLIFALGQMQGVRRMATP